MDYNQRTMMMYIADAQQRVIKRSFIPGSTGHPEAMIGSSQTIINLNQDEVPLDVASDWLGGNIYWTVSKGKGNGMIMMAKGDGRYKRSVVTSGLYYPTSVAVDPEHGLMFWSDTGFGPKIETAQMDGTQRRTIVDTNIGHPEAITIDFSMDHTIFWVDSKLGTIEMMDHNGNNRHVVARGSSGNLRKPVSIDVFESNMFWVNSEDGSVVQQDKFGRGVPVSIAKNLPNPRAIRVLHQFRYYFTIFGCIYSHFLSSKVA